VFSEGCGVLLLKAMSADERDRDNILGVIQGSGTNQDGKTNGITAPSSKAQEQLLRQVYDKFDIDPRRIGYVEAHGTATALGDPIEVNALTSAFSAFTTDRRYCALGSVKSNIGHTGFAAGVAGIVKVLLCIKHRTLVPSIHYRQPNPHIDFEKSPFYVNTESRDWDSDRSRMATVSSFGFSGTNAHIVIEEHLPSAEPVHAAPDEAALIPLSAKTEEQLVQKVRDLLDFIGRRERPVDLARLRRTLQASRDAMDHRLAVIVRSVDELADKLDACSVASVWTASIAAGACLVTTRWLRSPAIRTCVRSSTVVRPQAAEDRRPVGPGLRARPGRTARWRTPRRMTLPTYPFARERCWCNRAGRTRRRHRPRGRRAASAPASQHVRPRPAVLHEHVRRRRVLPRRPPGQRQRVLRRSPT
jgi:acyl transferase domain-containing protein